MALIKNVKVSITTQDAECHNFGTVKLSVILLIVVVLSLSYVAYLSNMLRLFFNFKKDTKIALSGKT
jgi:hypothetical protein